MKTQNYNMPNILNQGCCEEMLNKLYITFNKNMQKAIPRTNPELTDRNNLWWNDKLKKLRKSVGKKL